MSISFDNSSSHHKDKLVCRNKINSSDKLTPTINETTLKTINQRNDNKLYSPISSSSSSSPPTPQPQPPVSVQLTTTINYNELTTDNNSADCKQSDNKSITTTTTTTSTVDSFSQINQTNGNESDKFNCNKPLISERNDHTNGINFNCGQVKNLVHWFRKGLRLHDQPALLKGIKGCQTFRCVYLIDPWFSTQSNCGINKWRFLLQSLEDLDNNLHKLGSRLFVIRGQPTEVFPPLFKEWSITHLSFEEDPEPFGKIRDAKITKMCKEMNLHVICETSHTLYKLDNIIDRCGGEIPLTYLQFQTIVSDLEKPDEPAQTITLDIIGNSYTPVSGDHVKKYAVPTLEELGFKNNSNQRSVWIGGETEALQRLARHLEHKAWVATFGKPDSTSLSLLCAPQTGLGPYLRFGCISPRLLYHQLTNLFAKLKQGNPPLSLYGQLLWREFFYTVATNNPNFDKMQNNPLCVQIAWNSNAEALVKWANGQTGYPWIDAIQTQLRREGWIHQIAKHATVCFLTRGILWISWEEGMKIFDELLIDADWSVNAGTWMWLSCSSFFQRICHIYCPVTFGRKMDPQGDYIRRYLPVLRNIPNEYIHEPWKAPIKVQKEANCKIGKHYPQPIVDHIEAMRINQERMKQVFRILIKGLDLKKET